MTIPGHQSDLKEVTDSGNHEGKAKYAIEGESETLKFRGTLKPASSRSSMFSRMNREKVRE